MGRRRSSRRRRYERSFAKKCKEYFRHFIAFMFSNVGIILLVVAYTVMGAGIFKNTEGGFNFTLADDVRKLRSDTALRLYNVTFELNPAPEAEFLAVSSRMLLEYQRRVVAAVRQGYDGSNSSEYRDKWSIAGAFLYSLTVITTIGYGNVYPQTSEGKIITIIYAIIGMPLFLLYLSNIGDVMARSFKWIYANCCLCRWCPGVAKRRAERRERRAQNRYGDGEEQSADGSQGSWQEIEGPKLNRLEAARPSMTSEDLTMGGESEDSYDIQSVTVPVSICLMIMVGYICGGSILFCRWENWPFLDASYFCFISLSTIGFGDLVPGHQIYGNKTDQWSFVFCSTYLMVGMALIAMCFNLMQEEVIHKIRTTIKTVKYVLRCR